VPGVTNRRSGATVNLAIYRRFVNNTVAAEHPAPPMKTNRAAFRRRRRYSRGFFRDGFDKTTRLLYPTVRVNHLAGTYAAAVIVLSVKPQSYIIDENMYPTWLSTWSTFANVRRLLLRRDSPGRNVTRRFPLHESRVCVFWKARPDSRRNTKRVQLPLSVRSCHYYAWIFVRRICIRDSPFAVSQMASPPSSFFIPPRRFIVFLVHGRIPKTVRQCLLFARSSVIQTYASSRFPNTIVSRCPP